MRCATVFELKKVIKEENEDIRSPVRQLQLFLAKKDKGNGAWLTEDEVVADPVSQGSKPMKATLLLKKPENFGDNFQMAEGQIHVLVVVPQQKQDESLPMVRGLQRAFMEIKENIISLTHNESKSYTDGELGERDKGRLVQNNLFIEIAPIENEEALWSKEVQQRANAITNEAAFDAFITPFFDAILDTCGLAFVNSGKYQWLPSDPLAHKKEDLQPDGFATHRGMFRGRPVPNDSSVVSIWSGRGSVA